MAFRGLANLQTSDRAVEPDEGATNNDVCNNILFYFLHVFDKIKLKFQCFNTYQVTIELKRTNGAKIQTPLGDCYVYRADLTTLLPGE